MKPNWPDTPLRLFGPDDLSGTFDYLTKAIVGREGASRQDYVASTDDVALLKAIAGDENALGYFGLSYYMRNKSILRSLAVDDGDATNGVGPQMPTAENVRDKKYKPLSRPIFIYVSERALARPEVRHFVEYYLDNAQEVIALYQYIALLDQASRDVMDRFRQRRYGTFFGGEGSVLDVSLDDLMNLSIEELMKLPVD